MSDATTAAIRSASSSTRRGRRGARLIIVIAASAAAAVMWVVVVSVLGVALVVAPGGAAVQPIGLPAVLLVSLLGGLAGWAALAALERLSRRGNTLWTVIAATVLVASLLGPITSAVSPAAAVGLIAMHLVVGAVLILGLRRSSHRHQAGEVT